MKEILHIITDYYVYYLRVASKAVVCEGLLRNGFNDSARRTNRLARAPVLLFPLYLPMSCDGWTPELVLLLHPYTMILRSPAVETDYSTRRAAAEVRSRQHQDKGLFERSRYKVAVQQPRVSYITPP